MGRNKLRIIGAILAVVVVIAGGWVVGIAPQLAASAAANANRASVLVSNSRSQVVLAKLKKDFENIDQLKNELNTLRQSVPTEGGISSFVTELNGLASTHSVIVKSISVSDAKPYSPIAQTGSSASGSTTLVTDPKITPTNFVVIPLQFAVSGDYSKVLDFVHDVQYGRRLFLVTSLSTTGSTNTKGVINNASKPATSTPEKVDATLGGYIYVLLNQNQR